MVGCLFLCLWFLSLTATVKMAFEEKYTIVSKGSYNLSCDASPDQLRTGIHWRLDGVPITKNAHSNELSLEVTDRPDAGNYSCHANNTAELIKHYYILIDVGREPDKILAQANGNYITCHAEQFGGIFTCSWKMREKAVFSASYHREGWNGDSKDCVLTPCKTSDCTFQASCTDQSFSPYAEELRQITFNVEAATTKRYEKHTKHFYVRDILKPAAPKKLMTISENLKLKIDWQYPDSWNSPHSYFPLMSQVSIEPTSRNGKHKKYTKSKDSPAEVLIPCRNETGVPHQLKHHQNINCFTESSNVEISVNKKSHKSYRICVRVKELFFNSTWSEPTCINHRTKRRSGNY